MLSCLTAALLTLAPAADPAGPAPDVPELKALSHWAGQWSTKMTVKPNRDLPNGAGGTGTAVGEWVHAGRFLRQTWSLDSTTGLPKMSGSTMMTYDPQRKAYRSWSFFSTGAVSEATGTWDANTRTMTWTARDGDLTTVTTAAFTADGRNETWSIVTKDRAGNVVGDTSGTNTRKKE
jgi:hypothetical protein